MIEPISPIDNQAKKMNYYYALPNDIINLIDDKVNDIYKREHKNKLNMILKTIQFLGAWNDDMEDEEFVEDNPDMLYTSVLQVKKEIEPIVIKDEENVLIEKIKIILSKTKAILNVDDKYRGIDFNVVDMMVF